MGALKNRCTVAKAFVLLDAHSNVIRCSTLDSKSAGIVILQKFLDSPPILCHNQRDKFIFHLIKIVFNCFFSAQTKTVTKQLSKIKVTESKRNNYQKSGNPSIWSSSLDISL